MSRDRCESNLARLHEELDAYLDTNGIASTASAAHAARKIAESVFLAHSTSDANFVEICSNGGRLLSPEALHARGIKSLEPGRVEITLRTAGFVFLYAARASRHPQPASPSRLYPSKARPRLGNHATGEMVRL
jgi:hypothetical protein